MTAAAQVMNMRPSSAPTRASDSTGRQSGQGEGFEKALEGNDAASSQSSPRTDDAAASGKQTQDAEGQQASTRGGARGSEAESIDDALPDVGPEVALNDQMNSIPQNFALALAALSVGAFPSDQPVTREGQSQASPQPISDEAMLSSILNGGETESKSQAPVLPSDTDPLSETLSLLGISEDDVEDVTASAEQTVAKVTGQQTHLAISQKAPVGIEAYSGQLQATAAGERVPGASAPAEPDAVNAKPRGEAPVASPALTQEAVSAATAFSDGEGSSFAQDGRQQGSQGSQQQVSSPTQINLPVGAQTGSASTASALPASTFDGYLDDLSPGSQVARSITAEIAATENSQSNKDGVLKVLQIELKPHNLGTVTVRMSLKDDVISLHMETSQRETASAIEKERSALTNALKSAGYVVDEITTQQMDISRSTTGRIEAATNDAAMSSAGQGDGRSQAQQEFSNSGRGQSGQRNAAGDVSLMPAKSGNDGAGDVSRQRSGAIYV